MSHISLIKEKIETVLSGSDVTLYEVKWVQDGKMRILQVSIIKKDGTMDIDTCAEMSGLIGDMLDCEDLIASEYYLEVCSPGAERELRNKEEVLNALNEYIYIKYINPKDGMDEIKGYLLEVKENTYLVEYMDKAVKRKKEVEISNVAYIRLAVKI